MSNPNQTTRIDELYALLRTYKKIILTIAPGAACPRSHGLASGECLRAAKGKRSRFHVDCCKCWQEALELAEKTVLEGGIV